MPLEELKLAKRQWKSRIVAMEEQKCGNGRAKVGHVALEEQNCPNKIKRGAHYLVTLNEQYYNGWERELLSKGVL